MILRLLNPQGIAGLIVAALLGALLGVARIEVRHWKKQSAQFEQLYRGEVTAHATTIAAVRAATDRARSADQANTERVRRDQSAIDERTSNELEIRLAAVRARAMRLRQPASDATPGGSRRDPHLPGISIAAPGAGEAAAQARLPADDALIATEQAIQLDELIKWVAAQASVPVNSGPQ